MTIPQLYPAPLPSYFSLYRQVSFLNFFISGGTDHPPFGRLHPSPGFHDSSCPFKMTKWAHLLTERRNPESARIDEVSTLEMLAIINREDAKVSPALERELPAIAQAVDLVVDTLRSGGRLFYLGAGTSGRLGVLDAAECPPTYNTDPAMVQAIIAGGTKAVREAVEGAEDDANAGVQDLKARDLSSADTVIGIAASGVTPYVRSGIEYARGLSCTTIFFTCSPNVVHQVEADVTIAPKVGPEVITGSTRMKAGTATKLFLNMISTGAMVRLGKTYGNLMVDLQPKSAKLRDRTIRILSNLAHLPEDKALQRLQEAQGNLKLALVMEICGVGLGTARTLLASCHGVVRDAVRRWTDTETSV